MKINKKNVMASFTEFDQRTQDALENILTQLGKQEKEPNDYALVILQMLAVEFDMYFKAYDSLRNSDVVNVNIIGEREIHQAKPQVEIVNKSIKQITNMLDKLGISPLTDAKIRKLKSTEDNAAQDASMILASLVG